MRMCFDGFIGHERFRIAAGRERGGFIEVGQTDAAQAAARLVQAFQPAEMPHSTVEPRFFRLAVTTLSATNGIQPDPLGSLPAQRTQALANQGLYLGPSPSRLFEAVL